MPWSHMLQERCLQHASAQAPTCTGTAAVALANPAG